MTSLYIGQYLFFGALALVTILYLYFTRNFSYWKDKNVPFVKPLPFFGNIFNGILMRQSVGEIFSELYSKTTDPLVGFFMLDRPCLLLKDPKLIKRILVNDFQNFFDRGTLSNTRDDPLSANVLFILKNPDWKEIRTKVSPVFTSAKMRTMSQLVEEASSKLVHHLDEQNKNKSVVEMKDICIKYTVDVITSTVFGVNANSFKDNSEFYMAAKKIFDWDNLKNSFRFRCYFLAHSIVKLFRMKMLDPESANFLKKSFMDIMDTRKISNTHRNDLIDILIQLKKDDKHFIGGDILVSQAIMFFAAGFETTSSTMSFALYELALNQEIQARLRKEIKDISTNHGGINYESLKDMEYMDMCVKETLRKYPVLPFLERICNTRYTIPESGTVIDKGTPIFISLLGLQRDPKYFPNPELFDPERFSKTPIDEVQGFVYLPFGEGPRNCIGARFGNMTVKLGLAQILNNFIISKPGSTENVQYNPNGLVLTPLHGMSLKLERI